MSVSAARPSENRLFQRQAGFVLAGPMAAVRASWVGRSWWVMAHFPPQLLNSKLLHGLLGGVCLAGAVLLTARPAAAEFSVSPYEPPYEPPHERERDERLLVRDDLEARASTVRFHIGPGVLAQPTTPGLFAALDFGKRSVGARLSGSWLRAGGSDGLAAYTAELWVDFSREAELHPIVGAGAAWLSGSAAGGDSSAGAGLLRGALEYELPVADADARVGLNVSALVPAIGTERETPWVTGSLTVGIGF